MSQYKQHSEIRRVPLGALHVDRLRLLGFVEKSDPEKSRFTLVLTDLDINRK